jgi:urease accessory protein
MKGLKRIFTVAALMVPAVALAHPGHSHGLEGGLLHPFTGVDHLLAMVAIGMVAAQMKGRAVWAMPAAFVAALAVGGLMGLAELTFGPVEMVVALSVMVLGAMVALRKQLPAVLGLAMAAGFGLFHGFAHGLEAGVAPGSFLMGMVLASATLHFAGVMLVKKGQSVWGARLSKLAGSAMVLVGGAFLMS